MKLSSCGQILTIDIPCPIKNEVDQYCYEHWLKTKQPVEYRPDIIRVRTQMSFFLSKKEYERYGIIVNPKTQNIVAEVNYFLIEEYHQSWSKDLGYMKKDLVKNEKGFKIEEISFKIEEIK